MVEDYGWQYDGPEPAIGYIYTGPSHTVQRIADTIAAQGSIMPVTAPSVNSTWNLTFNGPSLHCHPVNSGFRDAVLANVLDYSLTQNVPRMIDECTLGPGYVAWHPSWMSPNISETRLLPFILNYNDSLGDVFNNFDTNFGYRPFHMASIFLVIAPALFNSTPVPEGYRSNLCHEKPGDQAGVVEYNKTSTVLRCDVHTSTYHTTFAFINGE